MTWEIILDTFKKRTELMDILAPGKDFYVPSFLKINISLLSHSYKRTIIVLPTGKCFSNYCIAKLMYGFMFKPKIKAEFEEENVLENQTNNLLPGNKLIINNSVSEIIRYEAGFINLKFSDMILRVLEKQLPPYNISTANLKINSYNTFAKAKQLYEAEENNKQEELNTYLDTLKSQKKKKKRNKKQEITINKSLISLIKKIDQYKTHSTSSIVLVTSFTDMKKYIEEEWIYGKNFDFFISFGQLDYKGNIKNNTELNQGFVPEVLIASDLYSIIQAIENGLKIDYIEIDERHCAKLDNELEDLDYLCNRGIPVNLITSTANSFSLTSYEERNFNVWRWNKEYLSSYFYDNRSPLLNKILRNCIEQKINYVTVMDKNIELIYKSLFSIRRLITDNSSVSDLFNNMTDIFFKILRNISPIKDYKVNELTNTLNNYTIQLNKEKRFISTEIYENISTTINLLKTYIAKNNFSKIEKLKSILRNVHDDIAIIIPEKMDRFQVFEFWRDYFKFDMERLRTVNVYYPKEYNKLDVSNSITIISGWLNRKSMEKILFSYKSENYYVLLYPPEEKWEKYAFNQWNCKLNKHNNTEFLKKATKGRIDLPSFSPQFQEPIQEINNTDEDIKFFNEVELDDIKINIANINDYVSINKTNKKNETIKSIPIIFSNNYLTFCGLTHKLTCLTNLFNNNSELKILLPNEVNIGDIIIVRDSDKNLIKELAENILAKNNLSASIPLSKKWQTKLLDKQSTSSEEYIFNELKKIGCHRNKLTIHKWITDEDMIAPQTMQDLNFIATLINEESFSKELKDIFNAAQTIKNAHKRAGKFLTSLLKSKIGNSLNEEDYINNNLDSIEIEDIGKIHILKVKEILNPQKVDISSINKLIKMK